MTTLGELFGAALLVPDAVPTALAASARARFAGFTRYALADRGSYDVIAEPHAPELVDLATTHAERVTGRSLRHAESRVLRLRCGDYLLAHHDRLHDDNPVEVTIDLSPSPVAGAEVHYRRRGQVFFRVPCTPGMLAIVERGPTVTCNHVYVSKRHADAVVLRLVALLRDR